MTQPTSQPFAPAADFAVPASAAEEVAHSPATPPAPRGLLDEILDNGVSSDRGATWIDHFRREPSAARALALWLGPDFSLEASDPHALKERIVRRLGRDVARIDAMIDRQVNAFLHHPTFQKLEASWRGLRYL